MGFDADMRKVVERLRKWGDANVVTTEAFSAVEGMINYHSSERDRLFEALQTELKRDKDIQGDWDNLCDKGLDLLERTNSSIGGKIPDGFRGLGMSDFYEGEKAAWQACRNGKLGSIAEGIFLCGQSNVEVFRTFEEDLKRSRDDAKVIDELARAAFGNMTESVRDSAVQVLAVLGAAPVAAIPMIGRELAPKVRKSIETFMGGSAAVRELTRKKAATRQVLVNNRELLDKAKEQIGPEAIEILHRKAQDTVNSWKGTASRGDYNADDWSSFARACSDILANKAVPAIEKAKSLTYTMRPLYVESITTAFVTLFSDPSSLASFDDRLSADVQKMMDDLAKEDLVIASLRDNEQKRQAVEEMKQIKEDMAKALKELKDALRESVEALRT